jgi:hypothetical protein
MDQPEQVIEIGFTHHLLEDFGKCCEGLFGPEAQFWRRAAFRSLFGFLEAWMSVNRNHFIPEMIREHGVRLLNAPEDREYVGRLLAATDPVAWTLTHKGEGAPLKRKLKFIPLLKANVRLARFVSGVPRAEVEGQFGQAVWGEVSKAVKVRDRLTHPHVHEDVLVGDEDVRCLQAVNDLMFKLLASLTFPKTPARYNDSSEESSPGQGDE